MRPVSVARDPASRFVHKSQRAKLWRGLQAAGDTVAPMEAMKMEMQVVTHRTGRITLKAAPGVYMGAGLTIANIGWRLASLSSDASRDGRKKSQPRSTGWLDASFGAAAALGRRSVAEIVPRGSDILAREIVVATYDLFPMGSDPRTGGPGNAVECGKRRQCAVHNRREIADDTCQ